MLLYARLVDLTHTKGIVGHKGQISSSARVSKRPGASRKENSELCFFFTSPAEKEPIELISVNKLKMLCAVRRPHTNTNEDRLDEIVRRLFPKPGGDDRPVSSDEVTVRMFSERIGFEKEQGRYIIDSIHASELPTYNAVSQSPRAADHFTEKFGGLYFIYRHDLNGETRSSQAPSGAIVRATLSIRYPCPTGRTVPRRRRVRAESAAS